MNPADGDVPEAYSSISCARKRRNGENSKCCWIVVIARENLTEGALFDLYQRREESEESCCWRRKAMGL